MIARLGTCQSMGTLYADQRKLIKIGANFDSEGRNLDGWKAIAGHGF